MKTWIIAVSLVLVTVYGCNKEDKNTTTTVSSLHLSPSTPPFALSNNGKFYSNINYSQYSETMFDVFIPAASIPTGIVIQIHGGGFKTGDKAENYNSPAYQAEVNSYLNDSIAYATLNYRLLLDSNEQDGVLKPLNDCKRALQFIRYYCKDFNIDKVKVVLKGGSAGAGTSLWIGLSNDMADPNSLDPILRESTRVKGLVANNTQATYDLLSWPTAVFAEYAPLGLDRDSMYKIATIETVLQFYGIKDTAELSTSTMNDYRTKVDMLNFISADDPEIYLASDGIPYSFPNIKGNLIHHPLHAKAIMNKANLTGVACKAYIPNMGINTTNNETAHDFLVRKLKE